MSTLAFDFITNANYFPRFCYSGFCAVPWALSCPQLKQHLKLTETSVFQEYDNEWGEYLDIEEADFASIKDKGKLRLILTENVSF